MNILEEIPAPRQMSPEVTAAVWARVEQGIAAEPASPPSRVHRWRRAGLGAAAAAAVAAVLVIQPWASTEAYASWTAVPDQVDAATLHSLGATCSKRQEGHFRQAATMHPVVGEQRGHFHAVLLGGDGALSACVDVPSGQLGGLTQLGGAPAPAPVVLDGNPGLLSGPDAFRIAYGRVTASVATVVLRTADGRSVTASTSNGYFLAWWPSGAAASVVEAKDAAGTTVGRVRTRPESSPTPSHQ